MKLIKITVFSVILGMSSIGNAQVTNWENSPLTYNNSPMNYNNSPMNYKNSPMNYNSNNGVYDNNGNRAGYEVKSPSGVTNYFDNNGNRTGYSPPKR